MTVKHTRLCYWIARPVKPGVQSSNTSRVRFTVISQTPGHSHFYHIYIVSKWNWDGTCLNWTQQSYLFFKYAICSIVLLNLGETCHLKGRDILMLWRTLLLLRWYDCSALWRHAVWTRIVTWHNAWMGYEYSLPNLNRPRAIHRHKPHPLETMGRVW